MRVLLCMLFAVMWLACSRSAVSKKLAGSDSLVIAFMAPGTDSVINLVSTTETIAIRKLARFLNGRSTGPFQCGYDGNMIFFKGGKQVMPVLFRFSEDSCRHFLFDLDNKVISNRMSPEAADFLTSLREGRTSY